ncbi:hypothetical protein DEO72_LG2g2351 [Vigna unguiculata]|uniref:Uncharacterized protein n=1 Tax=Vigna unguiculata TaxID=3917 RepID=A0A4D6KW60_VIGUN|nr:hypothetical protein DEO72_LG2g2351 [Vigna unguiculata]
MSATASRRPQRSCQRSDHFLLHSFSRARPFLLVIVRQNAPIFASAHHHAASLLATPIDAGDVYLLRETQRPVLAHATFTLPPTRTTYAPTPKATADNTQITATQTATIVPLPLKFQLTDGDVVDDFLSSFGFVFLFWVAMMRRCTIVMMISFIG